MSIEVTDKDKVAAGAMRQELRTAFIKRNLGEESLRAKDIEAKHFAMLRAEVRAEVLQEDAPDLAAEVIRLRKWQSEVLKRMEGWRDSLVETNDFGGLQYLDRLIAEAEGEGK